jgi:hypothetical protein
MKFVQQHIPNQNDYMLIPERYLEYPWVQPYGENPFSTYEKYQFGDVEQVLKLATIFREDPGGEFSLLFKEHHLQAAEEIFGQGFNQENKEETMSEASCDLNLKIDAEDQQDDASVWSLGKEEKGLDLIQVDQIGQELIFYNQIIKKKTERTSLKQKEERKIPK